MKTKQTFNNEHLIDTFDIDFNKGDFNGSNFSFFKKLLKTKVLFITYYYDEFIFQPLGKTLQGTYTVNIKDGYYHNIEMFVGSNFSKFTSLTDLTLSSRFNDSTFEWIKERPPKLKTLSIDDLYFISSISPILTKGLDTLEISDDIDEPYIYNIRDGSLSAHKKIKKVFFSNVYLDDMKRYFKEKEIVTALIKDLRLLHNYFPDSKILGFQQLINSLSTDTQRQIQRSFPTKFYRGK
tara:strand:- start:673 stop:1383 length:711 start_codon:yes stop_codon:yes gene_type:complete